ncbi:MAG TPA: hypothetical protein V6C97_13790 [Oculatellaceae cyanobacterium]
MNMHKLLLFCSMLCLGLGIRLSYYLQTPFGRRVHDLNGHIEYVRYVMDHATIPPSNGGFEFYQPPLFYFIAAIFTRIVKAFGVSTGEAVSTFVPLITLACALAAFVFAALVGTRLFRLQSEVNWRIAFVYFMAVFPGLVFMGGKGVNNDCLLLLLSYMFFWQLTCFWQTGKGSYWRAGLITMAASVLAKGNGILSIPTGFICLFLKSDYRLSLKIRRFMQGVFWLLVSCGWYFLFRIVFDHQTELCGNVSWLNDPPSVRWSAFEFSPLAVLITPFNHVWEKIPSFILQPERFWEFLFRSAFFGEWWFEFDLLGSATELLAMVLLLYALYGILFEIRQKHIFWPGLVTLVVQVLGIWLYRIRLGYFSAINNFRYIPVVLMPIIYYTFVGIRATSGGVRYVGIICLCAFGVCCFWDVVLVASVR